MASPDTASTDLITLPASGEIVDLNELPEVARALKSIRDLESQLREAKGVLQDAIIAQSQIRGSKTMHIDGIGTVEVRGGSETVYDAESIERELRLAGMPEDRLREIVTETVSYQVRAVEAKKAAAANEVYGRIISRHSETVSKRRTVSGP